MTFSIFSWRDKRKRKDNQKSRTQSCQDSGFEGSSISSSSSYGTSSSYTTTRRTVSTDSNLLASPYPRNQQYLPTHLPNHQQHHYTHATVHSISSSRSHQPVRQLLFSTSSSTASSWSASAAPSPSPKARSPQYRLFSSKATQQSPPLSSPHPFLLSSLSTASSTPPRSHSPVTRRFKTAFVRLLPRRPKNGLMSSSLSSSLSLPSFRNKAWRFNSSASSSSCATVTASSSVSRPMSSIGNSMFHASGASRADSSVAEAHLPPSPFPGSALGSFPDSSSTAPTVAMSMISPVMSTIHPLEITAPACFPGTGPQDIASKYEQLQQLQQSSRRPSVQRATLQRRQSSQQQVQHRVLTCPPASIVASSTGPSVGGRRHLIPHHHHLQGVAGLGPSSVAAECACPSTLGTSSLSCSAPPSPSTSSAPLQLPLPYMYNSMSWSSIANDRRSSLSGRSMDEMEVVSTTTLPPQLPSSHHRASLTVHSPASSIAGACSSQSLDNQRRLSSQSTTSSLVLIRPKILQPQNASSPLYPYQGDRKLSEATITTPNSTMSPEKSTSSTLGQGYDISTMFKVGPFVQPSPPSPIPFPSQSMTAAPPVMAT
ncbi:hypothetical protein EMPS_11008 [Entomortierella parvispora]|uniref:Uncharacterized protein n=1 Tax=Entomortierella parvispora TaxID=205924 RepID=A0A9P3HKU9_9FUNG|nr:hypothetical protein EMPS_11008 [Entomortierella parvispora]